MRGHQVSTQRRLNRHWQSGGSNFPPVMPRERFVIDNLPTFPSSYHGKIAYNPYTDTAFGWSVPGFYDIPDDPETSVLNAGPNTSDPYFLEYRRKYMLDILRRPLNMRITSNKQVKIYGGDSGTSSDPGVSLIVIYTYTNTSTGNTECTHMWYPVYFCRNATTADWTNRYNYLNLDDTSVFPNDRKMLLDLPFSVNFNTGMTVYNGRYWQSGQTQPPAYSSKTLMQAILDEINDNTASIIAIGLYPSHSQRIYGGSGNPASISFYDDKDKQPYDIYVKFTR